MKKILYFITAILLISSIAQAKNLAPGTVAITGTSGLGYVNQTQDYEGLGEVDAESWSLLFNAEYYVIENLGLGMIFTYDSQNIDSPMGDDDTNSLLVGPQLVYNISLNDAVSIPVFGAVGYASADQGDDDLTGWGWAVGTGVRYFLRDAISLDGYVVYDKISLENDIDVDIDDFQIVLGLSLYFGGM